MMGLWPVPALHQTAGTLLCAAIVKNVGNVRISNVGVTGDSNNCSQTVLLPGQTASCFVWKALTPEDFTADTFTVTLDGLSGTPAGSVTTLQSMPGGSLPVANPHKFAALLLVSVEVNTTSVVQVDKSVMYTIKLVSGAVGCSRFACLLGNLMR